MDKLRIGIVGVGGMGSHHAGYLSKGEVVGAELTAVCDIEKEKLGRWEGVRDFSDSRELIRSGMVDAVLIATPHYDHTTVGVDAFQQGLHVLTEKPISVHKADCERLIAAHKSSDRIFSAMFQMRTANLYKKIKKLIESGEIGEISRISWIVSDWFRSEAYYASGGWRATWSGEGGGVLLNQCPHNLDLMQWFFGMPSKVRSFCKFGAKHNIEVEDEVTTYLEYPNGATGVFITTTGEAPGTNRLEIAGDRGKLVVEDGCIRFFRNEMLASEFRVTSQQSFAKPDIWNVEIPYRSGGGHHVEITQNWVNAILKGDDLIAPAEEGIRSVEMANCMLYSGWTDATVNLPLDSAAYESALKERIASSRYVKKVKDIGEQDMNASFK